MKNTIKAFGICVAPTIKTVIDRAVAFLYLDNHIGDGTGLPPKEIVKCFDLAGLGVPNVTRLKRELGSDSRTYLSGKGKWRIKSEVIPSLDGLFSTCLSKPKAVTLTDSMIPRELVRGTRGYIEEVTRQLNTSYDVGCFDAAGVMVRRLIETLIIECFEAMKIESKIKDGTGNYFMLADLIAAIKSESSIHLGRNAKSGLDQVKQLGDQSAHNRRFLAKKADLDRVQPNVRVLVEELLTLAGMK